MGLGCWQVMRSFLLLVDLILPPSLLLLCSFKLRCFCNNTISASPPSRPAVDNRILCAGHYRVGKVVTRQHCLGWLKSSSRKKVQVFFTMCNLIFGVLCMLVQVFNFLQQCYPVVILITTRVAHTDIVRPYYMFPIQMTLYLAYTVPFQYQRMLISQPCK